ncbi:MAG: hypothetical protein IJ867_05860 [Clostridia bacterium]|nr:hypothetical protein [Clostridia bacterium]
MKEYNKEESIEMVNRINKMQRAIFKFKSENGREPSNDELASILEETLDRIIEIKDLLAELEKEDEKNKLVPTYHTKEDIEEAREIRKNKKVIKDIQKYIKNEF